MPPQAVPQSSALPTVRLEVRVGAARPTLYEVGDGGFLIGTVPGCDLRVPGANLAPVLCLIARHSAGASLRKLAPVQPVLVNGRAVGSTYLDAGDRISVGTIDILVTVTAGAGGAPPPPMSADNQTMLARHRTLQEQIQQLEKDRAEWFARRDHIEEECKRQNEAIDVLNERLRHQERELEAARADLSRREEACQTAQEEITRQESQLQEYSATSSRQRGETEELRQQLAELRQKLYLRYRARRDRLDKMEKAIKVAAQKLLDQKNAALATQAAAQRIEVEVAARQAQLDELASRLTNDESVLGERRAELDRREANLASDVADRAKAIEERERLVAEQRAAIDLGQKQHQADLVRLDRIQATLDSRKKQIETQALEVDRRYEQLQRDSRELEEQAKQLDEWHNRLAAETERLAAQKKEQEAAGKEADQRAATLEGQQAMLATLRTRLERMREELRRQEQSLSDQRALQEAHENDLRERIDVARADRAALDADRQLFGNDRRELDEKRTLLEASIAQLQQAQDSLDAEEIKLQQRKEEYDALAADQAEQSGMLVARGQQLDELYTRLTSDRQALREREQALAKSEQMIAGLQEQLRKRGEELASRERNQSEIDARLREGHESLAARQQATAAEQEQAKLAAEALRAEVATRSAELDALAQELTQREQAARTEKQHLAESEQALTQGRHALAAERIAWEVERQSAHDAAEQARSAIEKARHDAEFQAERLPDLEARVKSALDRLSRAREQLKEHLTEIHSYARQSRDDLEAARRQVGAEIERVRQQDLDLQVARDEHRLAVAAFRQQLIEWQGHVGDMREALLSGESRLDRKQAEVNARADRIAADAARLAQQVEQLHEKEKVVAERRGEMDRHLNDLREWYRRKMRELSGVDAPIDAADAVVLPMPAASAVPVPATEAPAAEHSILTLTDEVEPGDRQLGDLLSTLGLVDHDTLTAVLLEARRQRKSLRQLLLAGGYLTLYQIALIEAGSLDGLILGPVRVIDRLRATPFESVYRVFDPRRNSEALLRHLAEAEMADAVHPDEFRQRFAEAMAVSHVHVAATLEVLEIAGRPAVLQEWLAGVPGTDWPALASAPGVWFRLLGQATLALRAVHDAGLVHGHLHSGSFVMTGDGVLKLCGLGETTWLATPAEETVSLSTGPSIAADLQALGKAASFWATDGASRKSAKAKALPDRLLAVLTRLTSADPTVGFANAADLLHELEQAGVQVPPNAAAWERFLKQIRDQSADQALRRSA